MKKTFLFMLISLSSWGGVSITPPRTTVLPLPAGDQNYVQNSASLQSGTTFYVSSGTVGGPFNTGSLVVTTPSQITYGVTVSSTPTFFQIAVSTSGHFITGGASPSVTSCGTNPSVSGDDNQGLINIGSGVTVLSCTLNFANAWAVTPICVSVDNTAGISSSITSSNPASVTFTLSASLAGGQIQYQCGCSGMSCR